MADAGVKLRLAILNRKQILRNKLKLTIFSLLLLVSSLACEPALENLVGPSVSGFNIGVTAHYGGVGIVVSSGTATIRVEVFTAGGVPVNGATVVLTSTLGTLSAASFTTVNGYAIGTLTDAGVAGTAYVVATVENASATTTVPILTFAD